MIATGPADIRDQRWLDDQIAAIDDGIEAVLDIARNWTDGRNLARLHPGTSAQDYILSRVKSTLGRGVVEPLLAESNWSNRQIAAIAGVDEGTVRNQLRNIPQLERPTETLGADGKLRHMPTKEEDEPIDLDTVTPEAVAESNRVYIADLRKYLSGVVNMPAPPQTDPALFRRLRRGLVPALLRTLDEIARDN